MSKFFNAILSLLCFMLLIGATVIVDAGKLPDSYGELYENDASTSLTLPATPGDFAQWVSSTIGLEAGAGLVVGNATNDNIVIGANGAGVYEISFQISWSGSVNTVYHPVVFLNGSASRISTQRKIGTGSDEGSASAKGYLNLISGDTLDLRISSDGVSSSTTINHVQLTIFRIST